MDNIKINFNKNLKTLRIANNLSQEKLAKEVNVSVKTISHWETGYSEPSILQLVHLATILDVTLDDLVK